jgi:iron complex transport system ATP-binding protein
MFMHAISVQHVSFSYRKTVPTLRDISFDVERGVFFSLLGPNGSGKTTALRLLNRILLPESGEIEFEGRKLADYSRADLAKRIAFIPQDATVQFPFTVMEIVLMGRAPHCRGKIFESANDRAVAEKMLALADVAHLSHQPITNLSGGERQRVFIARALAQEPDVLLMDEPNAHLDIAHQIAIFEIVKRLNKEQGLTVVSVSHDLNLASAFSDRVGLLVCGSLVVRGTPTEVLTEKHIHDAFNTRVLVDRHPSSNVPRVSLITSH